MQTTSYLEIGFRLMGAANRGVIFEGDFKTKWNCSTGNAGPFCAYGNDDKSINSLHHGMKAGAITPSHLAAAPRNVSVSDVPSAIADTVRQGIGVIYLEEPGAKAWQQAPSIAMMTAIQQALGPVP